MSELPSSSRSETQPPEAALEEAPASQLVQWQVDTLRFTTYTADNLDKEEAERWWRDLTGVKDRNASITPVGLVEQGLVEGAKLTLQCQGPKIDWLLQPPKEEEAEQSAIYSLGMLGPSMIRFVGIIEKWLDMASCPVSRRIALGSVLLHPVETPQEGYRLLQPLLKEWVKLDIEGSSNFTYAINRRRKCGTVEDLEINRLAKWFVWKWQPVQVKVDLTMASPDVEQLPLGEPRLACRVDLDINTAPEYEGVLDPGQQKSVLGELRTLLEEIAEKGDVK